MSRIALAKNRSKSEEGLHNLAEKTKHSLYKRVGQRSLTDPELINSGSKGTVYKLETGKVLKITSDAGEAKAAKIIMDNPDENFYKVFDVFSIEDDLFGLVIEFLDPADDDWEFFGDLFNEWHTQMTALMESESEEDNPDVYLWVLPPTVKVFHLSMQKRFGEGEFTEQLKWLDEITEYLLEHTILFLDIHGRNIMKNPETGKHVLIDVGYSRTPEVEIEPLEEKSKIIAKNLLILADFF